MLARLVPSEGSEGESVLGLFPSSGSLWHSLTCRLSSPNVTLSSLCTYLCSNFPFIKDTTHDGLRPTSSYLDHLQRSYLQIRSHSQVLKVMTSASLWETHFNPYWSSLRWRSQCTEQPFKLPCHWEHKWQWQSQGPLTITLYCLS